MLCNLARLENTATCLLAMMAFQVGPFGAKNLGDRPRNAETRQGVVNEMLPPVSYETALGRLFTDAL